MISKTEKQKINDEVDELLDKFYYNVYDMVYDMHINAEMSKNEITAILVRDLRMGIDEVFKENFDV